MENFVKLYLNTGFTNREILSLLAHQDHITINIRTLKTIIEELKDHRDLEQMVHSQRMTYWGQRCERLRLFEDPHVIFSFRTTFCKVLILLR